MTNYTYSITMAKNKNIKLRAFSLVNTDLKHNETNLLSLLCCKLKDSVMNDRRMLISPDDSQREEDLIANFDLRMKRNECIMIVGTMLRIASVDGTPNITDDILNKEKVDIETLESIKSDSKVIYKSHYYFAVNNEYLVVSLPSNRTINAYQTYINEYLKDVREDVLYEFTPLLTKTEKVKFDDVKSIKIGSKDYPIGVNSNKETDTSPVCVKKIKNIARDILKDLIQENKDLKQILDEEIVSAELVLKISKRKNKAKEQEKALSAFLKPISDTDGIEVTTKNGKVTATNILKTKLVSIDLTESKHISEAQLFQEMEKFLSELSYETI